MLITTITLAGEIESSMSSTPTRTFGSDVSTSDAKFCLNVGVAELKELTVPASVMLNRTGNR